MKQRSDGKINCAANPSCPVNVSTSGAKEAVFTVTGAGTALTRVNWEYHGSTGSELPSPFRMKVVNSVTGVPVSSASVTYEVIRYTDKNGATSENVHGSMITRVFPPVTDIYGMSRAFLRLGTEEGVYTVRARCEACVSGQEQIATGIAHNYDVTAAVETVLAADPNANEDDCPSGCCPRTPVLQITGIAQPDGLASFTSAGSENTLDLHARVLPTCLLSQSDITWQVTDATGDYSESLRDGVSIIPPAGQDSGFSVLQEELPEAPQGRPLPLAYKVTAGVSKLGTMLYASKVIKQDEIDKCRQEYIDWRKVGEDLTAPQYFSRYVRGDFLVGVDGEHDPDYVRYIDCYAHIPPARESEVEALRSNVSFPIDVTSGFRSPRKNRLQTPAGVWNSVHQFGGGVDIIPAAYTKEELAARFKELWYKTSCPKALERKGAKIMAVCDIGQSTSTYKPSYDESNVFGLATCIHLGE